MNPAHLLLSVVAQHSDTDWVVAARDTKPPIVHYLVLAVFVLSLLLLLVFIGTLFMAL